MGKCELECNIFVVFGNKSNWCWNGCLFQKNVQFLQNELVIRVARRLAAFHSLPYIVAVNPDIYDTVSGSLESNIDLILKSLLCWTTLNS